MIKKSGISRRDFLKLAMLIPASMSASRFSGHRLPGEQLDTFNIIVIVFDAWSAKNASLYGYKRNTMPNLAKFAEKSTVFHNHYSAGTFTVPGTASLLTGTYPWNHRAFQLGGRISQPYSGQQLFSVLKHDYRTLGYTQNTFADQLLYQVGDHLDEHVRIGAFNIQNRLFYNFFKKDARMAYAAFENNIITHGQKTFGASLYLAPIFESGASYDRNTLERIYQDEYPRGLPGSTEAFLLDDLTEGAIRLIDRILEPSLYYLHFYPPHEPYNPTRNFYRKFEKDGFIPPQKEQHFLSKERYPFETIVATHTHYDEYLASWDDEFGRAFDYLEKSGILERSYVIITSDHGELFERGETGHFTSLIYDALINIPLIVSKPGQSKREDVFENTSSVDILPTIAHLAGRPQPSWTDGRLLPGLGGGSNAGRSIFAFDAKTNSSFKKLTDFSVSVTRDRYRLTYYQYPNFERFEFYNLENDPLELNNLYDSYPSEAIDMRAELLDVISDANHPFKE